GAQARGASPDRVGGVHGWSGARSPPSTAPSPSLRSAPLKLPSHRQRRPSPKEPTSMTPLPTTHRELQPDPLCRARGASRAHRRRDQTAARKATKRHAKSRRSADAPPEPAEQEQQPIGPPPQPLAQVLDDLATQLSRYVVVTADAELTLVALWAAH